jgi:ribonuclease HI
MVYIYTDGASRGNGGKSAASFIITNGSIELKRSARYLGNATNNIAEYMAVYDALEYCMNNNLSRKGTVTTIISDSQLIINQLKGNWKINKSELKQINDDIRAIISESGGKFQYEWVPRTHSIISECDKMNNKVLDMMDKSPLPGKIAYEGHEDDYTDYRKKKPAKTKPKRKVVKKCKCKKVVK